MASPQPARHMRWCPISCLLQLLLPVRDKSERGSWCLLSTSTASHHESATVYGGHTETPLRRKALPDGRQHRCRRDLNASHHLSGKSMCDERHFQVREGPERPEVGRSGAWTERQSTRTCPFGPKRHVPSRKRVFFYEIAILPCVHKFVWQRRER